MELAAGRLARFYLAASPPDAGGGAILIYRQPLLEPYPGTFITDSTCQVDNEEAFIALVKETLSSDKIRKAPGSLLSQAVGA